jgi:hypothetical protein
MPEVTWHVLETHSEELVVKEKTRMLIPQVLIERVTELENSVPINRADTKLTVRKPRHS